MIEVCNPATCELLATVPDCDAAEVDCAVATARAKSNQRAEENRQRTTPPRSPHKDPHNPNPVVYGTSA